MHWQKFMAVLMAVGLLFNFTGCKDEPELSPELIIEPTVVEAPAEGGDRSVTYTIKNPIEGSEIHATCEETWIADLHPSDSEILFTVLPNDKEETRSAVVTVNYAGIEPAPTFTINQAGKSNTPDQPDMTKDMFTLEATEITQMEASIIIVAEDPDITYFGFHKKLDNFDENLTEDEIYENDMEWLQGWADAYGVSLKKLMSKNLIKGDRIVQLKQLNSNTEYTYWVYGIDSKTLKRTTKITRVVFKTLEPNYSNAQISFTKEVNGDQLIVTYDPKDYTGYYYTAIYPICNPEFDETMQKRDLEMFYLNDVMYYKDIMQLPREEILKEIGRTGITKDTIDVEQDNCYLISALSFDDETFAITSDIFLDSYYHGNYVKFVLDLQTKNITGTSVGVDVTPNKDEEIYTVVIYESAEIQDKTEGEIMRDISIIPEEEWKLYSGKQHLIFKDLKKNTEYTIYGVAYNEEYAWVASGLSKTTFTTTDGTGDVEPFIVDITAQNITKSSAEISFVPNKESEEYTCMIYPLTSFQEMSRDEVIADMIAPDHLDIHSGSHTATFSQLNAGTEYVVCAVGYDAGSQKASSDLNKAQFKTENDPFSLNIEVSEIMKYSAKVVYTPTDLEADYTVMLLTGDEISGKSEQEIIDILTYSTNVNTHHDIYTRTYSELESGTDYAACAVKFNWDSFSAESGLFMKEFKTDGKKDTTEFKVDITVTDITATSATINYVGSKENREYSIMYYAYEDVQNATDEEILADMFTMENLWPNICEATWELKDLLPGTTYIACAAGMDSNTFTCNSGLFKTEFTTEAEAASDELTIDIAISDVTENSAKATFTPSDITKDFTTMIYTQAQFEAMTMEELVADLVDINHVNTHHDVYIKTFDELTPNTSYVVCAVGFNWDTYGANSEVFTMSLITADGAAE